MGLGVFLLLLFFYIKKKPFSFVFVKASNAADEDEQTVAVLGKALLITMGIVKYLMFIISRYST